MWGALGADRFGMFPNLKSLLRYLQMCVHSTVHDHARKAELASVIERFEDFATEESTTGPADRGSMLDRVYREEFWAQISSRLRNEQEQRVLYGSFVLGLKPREINAQWPDAFRDVKEVYRVKQNVLERLGRDTALRGILDPDA
jgi:DNA-directed RNA polymerase specialized sigma24 family protein